MIKFLIEVLWGIVLVIHAFLKRQVSEKFILIFNLTVSEKFILIFNLTVSKKFILI